MKLSVNQLVLVSGYLAVVTKVYQNHVAVNVQFQGKVISTHVCKSECKAVEEKAKYSKDAQMVMFGCFFSTGYIQLSIVDFNFDNVWGIQGIGVRIYTPRKVTVRSLSVQ